MDIIEIYSSKKKAFLLLIGSIFLFTLCFFLAIGAMDDHLVKRIVGIVGIVFFGLCICGAIKSLIRKKLMLVIDDKGILVDPEKTDDRILWQDINGFPVININGTKIILISVNNPQYWIDKETNKARKQLLAFNYDNFGAPFCLSSNLMQIKQKELTKLLDKGLEAYINKSQ